MILKDSMKTLSTTSRDHTPNIELCLSRHHCLIEPDAVTNQDLFQIFSQGKAGIEPCAEMRAAVEESDAVGLPLLLLIDREVGMTLKRIYANVPWWQRGSRQVVSATDIERLKDGDVLESTFNEFAAQSESLYEPLIRERDRYMALRPDEQNPADLYREVLVIIGAGQLFG